LFYWSCRLQSIFFNMPGRREGGEYLNNNYAKTIYLERREEDKY
jgi:hypothetical protein